MTGNAVLFSEMTPPADQETAFNAWYDEEHIPLRMAVPGFLGAQRYSRDGRNYLAVYDMDSPTVLDTPAYKAVKDRPSELTKRMLGSVSGFTRYIGTSIGTQHRRPPVEAIAAPFLYSVFFRVPEARWGDFEAWYEQDHVPILLRNPDWLMVRRFRLTDAHPEKYTHLALHYLQDSAALDSEERKQARATPWRAKLATEPWFSGAYFVFGAIGDRFWPG